MLKNFKVWRLFLCAMPEEAEPIIKYFNLLHVNSASIHMFPGIDRKMFGPSFHKVCDKLPIYMSGMNTETVLIITGIGKVNAAMAASYALSIMNPSEVINIGMCGSLHKNHQHGHIVSVKEVFQHDAYIPLKGPQYESLLEKIDLQLPVQKTVLEDFIEFNEVTLATGDSFVDQGSKSFEQFAEIADMEGFAIARVCQTYSVKLKMFKIVSDSSDEKAVTDFTDFISKYHKIVENLLQRI